MMNTLGLFVSPERLSRLIRPRRSEATLDLARPVSDISHEKPRFRRLGSEANLLFSAENRDRASSLDGKPSKKDEEPVSALQHLWRFERQRQIEARRRADTLTTDEDDDDDSSVPTEDEYASTPEAEFRKFVPEVKIKEPDNGPHSNKAMSGLAQLKKTLTPEIIRRRRGRRQASHGDVLSMPAALEDRRQSAPGVPGLHGDKHSHHHHHHGLEHFKDILRWRRGRRQMSSGDIRSLPLRSLPEMQSLDDDGPEFPSSEVKKYSSSFLYVIQEILLYLSLI